MPDRQGDGEEQAALDRDEVQSCCCVVSLCSWKGSGRSVRRIAGPSDRTCVGLASLERTLTLGVRRTQGFGRLSTRFKSELISCESEFELLSSSWAFSSALSLLLEGVSGIL